MTINNISVICIWDICWTAHTELRTVVWTSRGTTGYLQKHIYMKPILYLFIVVQITLVAHSIGIELAGQRGQSEQQIILVFPLYLPVTVIHI